MEKAVTLFYSMYIQMFMCMQARGGQQMICSIILQLIFWNSVSQGTQSSVFQLDWLASKGYGPVSPHPLYSIPLPPHHAGIMNMYLDSYMFAKYLNSGPHASVESTLCAETSEPREGS